jgi:hypothetical protein
MDGTILGDASVSLQKMLTAAVKAAFSTASVSLDSPTDAKPSSPGDAVVSLWLYRVTKRAEMLNLPPRRLSGNRLEAAALPVELHYLITPLGADSITRQRLVGVVMQSMYANAILPADRLEQPLLDVGVEALRSHLELLTIDELARIWHALTEPYQLSASYIVDMVWLPAGSEPASITPVLERRAAFNAIASLDPAGVP